MDDRKMTSEEAFAFTKETFFSPVEEAESLRAQTASSDESKPEYLTIRQELRALKVFSKALQRMSPNGRRAAICWLADAYLGLKLWSRW